MGGSVEKQIQKALGSLPPCGNRCRFSESAICSSRVHPPSEIKSNFKFKTLRWRPLRWRLTLSDHRGPVHGRTRPHKRVTMIMVGFSLLKQPSRSSTLGELLIWMEETYLFDNDNWQNNNCFMGRREEKLQKLTLSLLLDGFSLGAHWVLSYSKLLPF